MGGKSCLATTFPPAVSTFARAGKPPLNGSGSYFSPNSSLSFGLELGLSTQTTGNCGIPATVGADLAVGGR
jgi:hypothetical protein